eukprot:Gb_12842 [translate_table: standard]
MEGSIENDKIGVSRNVNLNGPKKTLENVPLRHWNPYFQLDVVLYNALINACIPCKEWNGVELEWNTTYSAIYGLMMEVMLNSGKYDLVYNFFEKMEKIWWIRKGLHCKEDKMNWKSHKFLDMDVVSLGIDSTIRKIEDLTRQSHSNFRRDFSVVPGISNQSNSSLDSDFEALPLLIEPRASQESVDIDAHGGKLSEGLEIDKDALKLLASKSNGSLRDAEMTLDQLSLLGQRISLPLAQELVGMILYEKLVGLPDLALSADTINTMKCLRELMEASVDPLSSML